MKVLVNGDPVELDVGSKVVDAVAAIRPGATGRGIAVAVNGTVVPRSSWSDTSLEPDDKVEVLTAVAGG